MGPDFTVCDICLQHFEARINRLHSILFDVRHYSDLELGVKLNSFDSKNDLEYYTITWITTRLAQQLKKENFHPEITSSLPTPESLV